MILRSGFTIPLADVKKKKHSDVLKMLMKEVNFYWINLSKDHTTFWEKVGFLKQRFQYEKNKRNIL